MVTLAAAIVAGVVGAADYSLLVKAKPNGAALDGAFLKGELDKVPSFYKVGDEIVFTIGLWMLYDKAPCHKKSIHWIQGSSHGYVPPPPYQEFDVSQ